MMHKPSVTFCVVIWAALLALLLLTYGVGTRLDLGPWNFAVAFAIALTKASLIILFFMHIYYSQPLVRLVASTAFSFWRS